MRKIMLFAAPWALLGCQFDLPDVDGDDGVADLTLQEARMTVEQVNVSTRGDAAVAELLEVSNQYSPDDAPEQILQNLNDYFADRSDCVELQRQGNQIRVDFGTLQDQCGFEDQNYAGVDTITFAQDAQACTWCPMQDEQIGTQHLFEGFTNGKVTVDGLVESAFLIEEPQGGLLDDPFGGSQMDAIDVILDYKVSRFDGAPSLEVQGEHTIVPLVTDQPMLQGGFELDGTRNWETMDGSYLLELNGLKVMTNAAAPHDGSVKITDPLGRKLTIRYDQLDDSTISARITGDDGEDFTFYVNTQGDLQGQDGQGGQGGGMGQGGDEPGQGGL